MGFSAVETPAVTVRELDKGQAEEIWKEINGNAGKITLDTSSREAIPLLTVLQRRDNASGIYHLEWAGDVQPKGASVAGLEITHVSETGIVFTSVATPIGTAEWVPFRGGKHELLVYLDEDFA